MTKTATKKTTKAVKASKSVRKPARVKRVGSAKRIATGEVQHLFILDSSGSMDSVRDVTRVGFNEQVQTIRKAEKENKNQKQFVTFYTFSDKPVEKFFNVSSTELKELGDRDYLPSGNTALNDCIGTAVTKLRAELKDKPETAVIVTILTDGMENASREYSTPQIADLLKDVQKQNKWTVTYIGANQDVHAAAKNYSIPLSNVQGYTSSAGGTSAAMRNIASTRSMYLSKLSDYTSKGITTSHSAFDNSKMFNAVEAATEVKEDGSVVSLKGTSNVP